MRKFRTICLVTLLMLILTVFSSCGSSGVIFESADIEGAVRQELGFAEGEAINEDDLILITELAVVLTGENDFSDLSLLPNLELFMVMSGTVDGFKNAEKLTSLKEVILFQTYIKSIAGLERAPCVEVLGINGSFMEDYEELSGLQNLKQLSIPMLGVENIDFVCTMEALEILSIPYNLVADISPVAELKNLRDFNAEYNLIKDISPLEGTKNLLYLNLNNNLITDISALAAFPHMEKILLRGNVITNRGILDQIDCPWKEA